jgi:rhodanese-related sulfurtransferase
MTPAQLRERLLAREELALLDVREQGVHYQGHPFFACALPLSRLELLVRDLLPRRSAPLVLLDGGGEGLAERAAAKLKDFGYTDIDILEGGCAAWKATGGELFSGVNVPSKAFGEFIEHHYGTPRIPPAELKRLLESKRKLVILDSRPWDEYHRMNIPGGIDVPGAELVYRTPELAPDPDTLVVVNCAGRTRSIIGCQSLRNAGWKDVVALKDDTMGWELAGFEVERGSKRVAPEPTPTGKAKARAAADGHRVTRRSGPGWLLIGDAAGFLDPFTGEGLHRAFVTAGLGARAVAAVLGGRPEALDDYARDVGRRFDGKDLVTMLVQGFLASPPMFGYAARRLATRASVRETMGLVIGDLAPASRALDPRFLAALLAP